MEVDEATIVTASTKRGASEDPQDAGEEVANGRRRRHGRGRRSHESAR